MTSTAERTTTFDPIELEVLWQSLIATVNEQARALQRAAFSPIVREAGDLANTVFDRRGRMVAQAVTGTPGHINSLARAAAAILDEYPTDSLEEGDVLITNDPYKTAGQLLDVTVLYPVFVRGKVIVALTDQRPPPNDLRHGPIKHEAVIVGQRHGRVRVLMRQRPLATKLVKDCGERQRMCQSMGLRETSGECDRFLNLNERAIGLPNEPETPTREAPHGYGRVERVDERVVVAIAGSVAQRQCPIEVSQSTTKVALMRARGLHRPMASPHNGGIRDRFGEA